MSRYYYDLHTHSCLSPCADNDNTPNDLAGMASLCGINLLALTDHNSCKNCPAFFAAAKRYGVIPVPGMELTTSEDIHVVCLFADLESAMEFDKEVDGHRVKIANRKDIFGDQLITDEDDRVTAEEPFLLPNATDISLEDVPALVGRYGGVCYPAHIDREANGIISVLGTFPDTPSFTAFELRDSGNMAEYETKYGLSDKVCVISSDAHRLTDMRDAENFFDVPDEVRDDAEVRRWLIATLRG